MYHIKYVLLQRLDDLQSILNQELCKHEHERKRNIVTRNIQSIRKMIEKTF